MEKKSDKNLRELGRTTFPGICLPRELDKVAGGDLTP
jgi:hypothetical protein